MVGRESKADKVNEGGESVRAKREGMKRERERERERV